MHARVYDQSTRSPGFIGEAAKITVGILVKAHFLTEALRIKPPTLTKSRMTQRAPERRQILLLRQRGLQMVARDAFVQRQGLQRVQRFIVQVAYLDKIRSRVRAVTGRWFVIGAAIWVADDLVGRAWQSREETRQLALGRFAD